MEAALVQVQEAAVGLLAVGPAPFNADAGVEAGLACVGLLVILIGYAVLPLL